MKFNIGTSESGTVESYSTFNEAKDAAVTLSEALNETIIVWDAETMDAIWSTN